MSKAIYPFCTISRCKSRRRDDAGPSLVSVGSVFHPTMIFGVYLLLPGMSLEPLIYSLQKLFRSKTITAIRDLQQKPLDSQEHPFRGITEIQSGSVGEVINPSHLTGYIKISDG